VPELEVKLGLNRVGMDAVFEAKQFAKCREDDFHGIGLIQFKSLWRYQEMFLGLTSASTGFAPV